MPIEFLGPFVTLVVLVGVLLGPFDILVLDSPSELKLGPELFFISSSVFKSFLSLLLPGCKPTLLSRPLGSPEKAGEDKDLDKQETLANAAIAGVSQDFRLTKFGNCPLGVTLCELE